MKRKIIGITMFTLLSLNVSACMLTHHLIQPSPQVSLAYAGSTEMGRIMDEARAYVSAEAEQSFSQVF